MNTEPKPKKIVIKKYENRRLYDTARSQYVNLDEVAQLVRDGNEVQALDAATGEDITRLILTQIIVENAKSPNSVFPLQVLRQMVVASGRATQESALKYIKAAFDMYQTAFRAVVPGLNPFELMNLSREPREASPEPHSNSAGVETGAMPSRPAPDRAEVAELRRRIEELEALASKPKVRATRRKRRPKRLRSR
ncbi:MAG TPA: polyhydroxyalkanoate synthesis regulator DNA-binding domain-containing protein [Terriglobia bacterium]|nr:polyhydroxyalkanoate synthesis regulator DNA-binding domain-containing protein [Terriglobia bacterium]